jgi:hypothetical protein
LSFGLAAKDKQVGGGIVRVNVLARNGTLYSDVVADAKFSRSLRDLQTGWTIPHQAQQETPILLQSDLERIEQEVNVLLHGEAAHVEHHPLIRAKS